MIAALHVAFGTLALIAGPLALVLRKGGFRHAVVGRAFALAIAVVLITAGFMWQALGHTFLVPLGFVSGYLALHGLRATARRRRKTPSRAADAFDIVLAVLAIVAGGWSIVMGADRSTPFARDLAPALIGIGFIGCAFGLNELLGFTAPRGRLMWRYSHLAAMIGTYIAGVTAFIVINAHGVPMVFRWAVPSAIGGMTIVGFVLQHAFSLAVAPATPSRNRTRLSSSQANPVRGDRRSGEVSIQAHGASSHHHGR